jgi:hypothetical protein
MEYRTMRGSARNLHPTAGQPGASHGDSRRTTGGAAIGAGQETEGGQLRYEVKVQTSSGRLEVEVRAVDGGVVEIEPDDGD